MIEAGTLRQRLDKWLWFARVVKSRTLAAKLVLEGHVRVNGVKADAPAKLLNPGDTLTIALDRQVRVLRVIAPGTRRGPFPEASQLFADLTLAASLQEASALASPQRESGAGRPSKKQRREIDRLQSWEE